MPTMTGEGSVTRTELSLDPYAFGTSASTDLVGTFIARNGFSPGAVAYRRITAQGPHVAGRILVHAVKDVETAELKLRFAGSDQQDLWERIDEGVAAFSQSDYTLYVNINGRLYIHDHCEVADYTLNDGAVDDLMARSNIQYVTFSIPHNHRTVESGFSFDGTYPIIE